ncbi:TIM barrel protein [Palleronia caenipelagi]|uniref:TIM barrel protein n=1 Tax=Palleronia caenipelagi TaxID=2489174 RepID=A0A547Q6T0_9RHOB|nr:TIM barrel protein [Palleronia caenipelagi]
MTAPVLAYPEFLDLAAELGCVGVELRNDLGRLLFDGIEAAQAGDMARARGLRILGLSEVPQFNDWGLEAEARTRALIGAARDAGAETISLIPRNDGLGGANGERQANLRIALKAICPLVREAGLRALVEPLGFASSSLCDGREVAEVVETLGMIDCVSLVYDTFHAALAGGAPMAADRIGIVHISGVTDPGVGLAEMQDGHRVLVADGDRLGNTDQIAALLADGYDGVFSFECFSPEVQRLENPADALRQSMEFITSRVMAKAA